MTIIDHIFGHCYGVGVRERCSDLLWTVKENLEAFYIMKGVNKRKAAQSLQQAPYRPMRQGSTTTPDFKDFGQLTLNSQLQTPMENLDFESLLGGLNAGSGSNVEGFEDFMAHMPQGGNDPGAIFVPVDSGVQIQGNEWMDSGVTRSPPNVLQQWVSYCDGLFILPSN